MTEQRDLQLAMAARWSAVGFLTHATGTKSA